MIHGEIEKILKFAYAGVGGEGGGRGIAPTVEGAGGKSHRFLLRNPTRHHQLREGGRRNMQETVNMAQDMLVGAIDRIKTNNEWKANHTQEDRVWA